MANSKKRCKFCKGYFLAESMIVTNIGLFCSEEDRIDWGMANREKGRKKIIQAEKARDAYRKKQFKSNDLSHQHELTQPVFNKLRRLQEFDWFKSRGLEPECISCGKTNMDWCNGHFKTVGSQSNLRYELINSYLQCNRYCNRGLSGNISGNKNTRGYIKGLLERFGSIKGQEIIDCCETNTQVRIWTCDELIAMRKDFNRQIREIEAKLC